MIAYLFPVSVVCGAAGWLLYEWALRVRKARQREALREAVDAAFEPLNKAMLDFQLRAQRAVAERLERENKDRTSGDEWRG